MMIVYGQWRNKPAASETLEIIDSDRIGQLEEIIFKMESDVKGSLNSIKNDMK